MKLKQLDKNLCQAVDCKNICDHISKCVIIVDNKERIEEIRFCHDHFLRQKAVDYQNEGLK
tara:strand:+ start:1292 stop:1474 length:183 start_codon:yes stop_codon:yes gene_type:complete